jgi:hypothetical protein
MSSFNPNEVVLTENISENNNQPQEKELLLVDIAVTDENVALNLMVSFLSLAQKRGVFSFDESAKIWECIKTFERPNVN